MPTQKVYCFFDRVSQGFLPNFFLMPNDDVAKRSFSNFANNPKFPFADIKSDLEIYKVADFDVEQGLSDLKKEFVCALVDLVRGE